MLVLPALVGMKDQVGTIRYLLKSSVKHGGYHDQNRSVKDCIADQMLKGLPPAIHRQQALSVA